MEEYKPTRPLTTDDYMAAANVIAKCDKSKLPIVLDYYRKAGLDIAEIPVAAEQMAEAEETEDDLVQLLSQYSLKQLCELLHLNRTSIHLYRSGKGKPYPERRQYIIQVLSDNRKDDEMLVDELHSVMELQDCFPVHCDDGNDCQTSIEKVRGINHNGRLRTRL